MGGNYKGWVYAFGAAVCFGVASPFLKVAVDNIPLFFLESFVALSALCFFIPVYFFSRPLLKWQVRRFWKEYVLLGVLSAIIPNIFGFLGYQYGYASNAAVLFRFEVFAVLIYSALVFKERISPRQIFGILLGFFGIILFVTQFRLSFIWGDLFILLAGLFFASFPLIVKNLQKEISVTQMNIVRMMFMVPFFLTGMFLFEHIDFAAYLPYLPHLFIGGTLLIYVIGVSFYAAAIKYWDVWKVVFTAQFGAVIFGYVSTTLMLGEAFLLWQWVGTAIILLSIIVVLWQPRVI